MSAGLPSMCGIALLPLNVVLFVVLLSNFVDPMSILYLANLQIKQCFGEKDPILLPGGHHRGVD